MKLSKDINLYISIAIAFFAIRCTGFIQLIYILIGLWFCLYFITQPTYMIKMLSKTKMIYGILFLSYILFSCTIFGSISNGIGNTLRYFSLFIGAFIYEKYKDDINKLSLILHTSLIIWTFYVFRALIFYGNNPGAARDIMSHQGEIYGNVAIGGGYGLGFGSALFAVFLIGELLFWRKLFCRKYNLMISAAIIILIILCIKTESTITLLAAILGVCINLFLAIITKNGKRSTALTFFAVTIIILLFLLGIYFKNDLGHLLTKFQLTGHQVIDGRIQEIGHSMLKSELVGDAALRYNVYIKSIKTMFTSPLLGSIASHGYATTIGVSGHSELLDVFAMYGWGCGLLFVLWYGTSINIDKNRSEIINIGYYVTAWILLLANQFTYSSASWMLFFIVPASNRMLILKEKNYNMKNNLE